QSDRIRVYFNQDTDPSVSAGTLAISLHGAMDDTLEAYIDRALYTIDVAVYNANDYSIMYALNDARDRGVQVRYIAEGSTSNTGLSALDPSIPVLFRTDGEGSGMHNKFMSIDADHEELAWVWTGSTNWTQNGLFDDYNNMVFIQDRPLALAYRTEFEEMWGGTGALPDAANSRFGADKTNNTPHTFNVDGVPIECWFSPSDGTTARLVDAVDGAEHDVRAALFAFTNDDLGNALLDAHQRPGVTVRLDLEEAVVPGTEGWYLASNGVDVASHSSDAVQLHHKYAIIDEGSADDPLVITGSHNWSWFAETINDENTLVIHDATVANLFYQEWHARRNDVVGMPSTEHASQPMMWPVPTSGLLHIALPTEFQNASVMLIDAAGRVVQTYTMNASAITADLTALVPGVYTVRIDHRAGVVQQRVLVVR
ncbi:MAG: T9SS type A sorting domain-containing protein, partial [Flavobacteriales bacterium]|nr:T9SS type A sorting domain-containing protein [Flavobacteriales bacterium]